MPCPNKTTARLIPVLALGLSLTSAALSAAEDLDWWPNQRAPERLATLNVAGFSTHYTGPDGETRRIQAGLSPEHMTAQSLAGLAAMAVNEGRHDELVWIQPGNHPDYTRWKRMLRERTGIGERQLGSLWDLVAEYKDEGIVEGYILYATDRSEGALMHKREGSDESANVATSLAGVLNGIIIAEEVEARARALGLRRLLDVRDKSETWAFENYRDRFDRRHVLLQDPKAPHNRAIAVAHRIFCTYGLEEPTPSVYRWIEAPGLVIGWNGHGEYESVSQLSRQGHVISASNWALNLPALSVREADDRFRPLRAASAGNSRPPVSGRPAVSFFLSDGDNLQWALGNFFSNERYWGSGLRGEFPFGWGLPVSDLLEVGVDAYAYARRTATANDGFVLKPSYHYPDELAIDRDPATRERVLRALGARIEATLAASGLSTMAFIARDWDSEATREACQAFADASPSLKGLFAMQYYPYNAGEGFVYYVHRSDGEAIPVFNCRYMLWANTGMGGGGDPEEIADYLNIDLSASPQPVQSWVSIHAWSKFDTSADAPEANLPTESVGIQAAEATRRRLEDSYQVLKPTDLMRVIRENRGN